MDLPEDQVNTCEDSLFICQAWYCWRDLEECRGQCREEEEDDENFSARGEGRS